MAKKYTLTELEKEAWKFAYEAHKGVERKFSKLPYFYHVSKVFKLVKKIDPRPELAISALLHDTVEDVDWITHEVISEKFGEEVSNLVFELTSNKEKIDEVGKKEYLSNKLLKMSNDALVIKLCDRFQNLSDHFAANDKFRKKYYEETKYIIKNLKKERHLNRKQINVVNWIEGLLKVIHKRYKLHTFESFSLTHYGKA